MTPTDPVDAAADGQGETPEDETASVPTPGEEDGSSIDTPAVADDGQPLPLSLPTEPTPDPSQEDAADTTGATAGPTAAAGRTGATPSVEVRAERNYGTMIGQQIKYAVGILRGTPLPRSRVNEQLEGYVPAKSQAEAARLLYGEGRVVVLVADAHGSGRWTEALKLLRDVPGEDLTIRRVRRETGDNCEIAGLRPPGPTGWILDLRSDDDSVPNDREFGSQLMDAQVLEDTESRLVVVASTALWRQIGGGATAITVPLDPPDAVDVLTAYFELDDVRQTAPDQTPAARAKRWMQIGKIGQSLKGMRPAEVRKWAEDIDEVESRYRANPVPEKTDDELAATVVKARSSWRKELTTWHSDKERTSFERNYLLVRAVFAGRPLEDALSRVASLAKALGEEDRPPIGQVGPGLVTLTHEIGAELRPDGEIRFPGPGYAEAVVEYFWADRPHLLDKFTEWTVDQCLGLKEPDRGRLANQVIPWILDHARSSRSTVFLRSVVTLWAAKSSLVSHAVNLLVLASLDPQIGSLTRKATAGWVVQDKSTPELKVALAQALQQLALAYPKSLRTLSNLAETDDPKVSAAVGETTKALWGEPKLRQQLQETLIKWLASPQPALRHSAASTVLHLAQTLDDATDLPAVLLTEDGQAPDWVIEGWRQALEDTDLTPLAFQVGVAWLDAVATFDVDNPVTHAFARAVQEAPGHHRGTRSLNFFRIAEHWYMRGKALDEPTRNRRRALIVSRVDADAADPAVLTSADQNDA